MYLYRNTVYTVYVYILYVCIIMCISLYVFVQHAYMNCVSTTSLCLVVAFCTTGGPGLTGRVSSRIRRWRVGAYSGGFGRRHGVKGPPLREADILSYQLGTDQVGALVILLSLNFLGLHIQ